MRDTEDDVIGSPQVGAGAGASMGKTAVRSVFWVGAGQAIKQFIAIGTSIVLARLLAPNDFGVFAMIYFAAEIAQVFTDFGFGSAIIQRRVSDDLTLSTCFWLNIGIAILAGVALVAAGPLLANFFRQPILALLAFACALNILLSCCMVVPQALLSQRFEFRKQIQAQLVGSLVGAGSAIFAAYHGAGVWSLIVQPLAGSFVTLAMMLLASHWFPRFNFNYATVVAIVRFGMHLLGSNVLQTFGRSLHNIILGRWLGSGPLGSYNMALQVTYAPIYLVSVVVVKVLFPTLVHLDNEPYRLKSAYLRIVAAIALITFPCMTGLFAITEDFVLVVFGEKWLGMVPVLKVICWVVMLQSVATTATTILLSKGYSKTIFNLSILSMVLTSIGLLIGSQWGLLGTAIGWSVASTIYYLSLSFISTRAIGTSLMEFLSILIRPFVVSLTMSFIIIILMAEASLHSSTLRLVTGISIGLAVYPVLTYLLNRSDAVAVLRLIASAWGKR